MICFDFVGATDVQTQNFLGRLDFRLLYLLVKVCFLSITLWFRITCKFLLPYLILQLFTLLLDQFCLDLIVSLAILQLRKLDLVHFLNFRNLFVETLFNLFDAFIESPLEFLEICVFISVAFCNSFINMFSLWSFTDFIYFNLFQLLYIFLALLHILR